MKIKFIFLLTFLFFLEGPMYAQKENNSWYFGQFAGMDFSTNPPTSLSNSGVASVEGSASVSDSIGNLLFYTDGMSVFTKNHTLMQNGSGLNGFFSNSQPASIIRLPGSKNLYYLFYSSGVSIFRAGGYSIIDMSLNNGLGKVISKNIVFANQVAEGMIVVPHADSGKYWIVYNVIDTAQFQAYLFDCKGVSNAPVRSNTGIAIQFGVYVSNLSVSHNYKKIVSSALYFDDVCLMDFDNATGLLSNPIHISVPFPFGSCFSPNNNVLYINHSDWNQITGLGTNTLLQFDISSNQSATILASKITLDTVVSTLNGEFGQMQLAPNNKIYMARFSSTFLPSISNPDNIGFSCNYVRNDFDLSPNSSNLGLPSIAYVSPIPEIPILLPSDTSICGTEILLKANYNLGPYLWNTGDTSASITVNQSGQYWVNTKICLTDFSDTINITLDSAFQFQLDAISNNEECNPSQTISPTFQGDTYLWNNQATTSTITVHQDGIYQLEMNSGVCTYSDTILINFEEEIKKLALPNAFTPNEDELNDYFELKSACYSIIEAKIFNRWGELINETKNSNVIWDGKSEGIDSSIGVYSYSIKLKNSEGDIQTLRGNLNLLR